MIFEYHIRLRFHLLLLAFLLLYTSTCECVYPVFLVRFIKGTVLSPSWFLVPAIESGWVWESGIVSGHSDLFGWSVFDFILEPFCFTCWNCRSKLPSKAMRPPSFSFFNLRLSACTLAGGSTLGTSAGGWGCDSTSSHLHSASRMCLLFYVYPSNDYTHQVQVRQIIWDSECFIWGGNIRTNVRRQTGTLIIWL